MNKNSDLMSQNIVEQPPKAIPFVSSPTDDPLLVDTNFDGEWLTANIKISNAKQLDILISILNGYRTVLKKR